VKVKHIKGTRYVEKPEWLGHGFADSDAHAFWVEMPENLKKIAVAEITSGNTVAQILRNDERGIVLLVFENGPLSEIPADEHLVIHTRHAYGNYCYDGTKCTYEDKESGSFLAFDDPAYEHDVL
jgi:hypothetical protein